MDISLCFTADSVCAAQVQNKTAAVIDVLRATSVITTAIKNGAKAVAAFKTIEEALEYKNRMDIPVLLGGERKSLRIEGFDFSNSPLEYTVDAVCNQVIAITTTNGTIAIENSKEAETLYILSFLNLKAVCDAMVLGGGDLVFVCAGTYGRFSLDDALCAGKAISYIAALQEDVVLDDGAMVVKGYFEWGCQAPAALLSGSGHYEALKKMGFQQDLDYCLKEDIYDTVPVYRNGLITNLRRL